jgi:hypothetical protein
MFEPVLETSVEENKEFGVFETVFHTNKIPKCRKKKSGWKYAA